MKSVLSSFHLSRAAEAPEQWWDSMAERIRNTLLDDAADPAIGWILSSEGFAACVRHVERHLTFTLDDHVRARAYMMRAYAVVLKRRISRLRLPVQSRLAKADVVMQRAFFEALAPGPIARSIRWMLDGLTMERPDWVQSAKARRLVEELSALSRRREIAPHCGEWLLQLMDELLADEGSRAQPWLNEAMETFGREIAALFVDLYRMPPSQKTTVDVERMAKTLFPVDGSRDCPSPFHAELIRKFRAGVSDTVDEPSRGIMPICNLEKERWSSWTPPTSLKGYGSHAERMANLADGKNPAEGFFGPASQCWRCGRESVMLLGGGRAALMQLAHPAVAHAIRDHSVVHTDMVGRFMRTMTSAYGVIFDSVDDVMEISHRVYEIHKKISGRLDDVPGQPAGHYHALDPEAVFWVGATLLDTTVLIYDTMIRPLETKEKDRWVREFGPFWAAFGLPIETCPTTWRDLQSYILRRTESLAPLIGESARKQAAQLFGPHPPWTQPAFDQMRLITAYLLPDSLRNAFGMQLDPRRRLVARTWLFLAEQIRPALPEAVRFVPTYHQASLRLWRAKLRR